MIRKEESKTVCLNSHLYGRVVVEIEKSGKKQIRRRRSCIKNFNFENI